MCGMCPDVLDGCSEIGCGALSRLDENGKPRKFYMRWFMWGDTPCEHVLGRHKPSCAIRDGVRCNCYDED